jgi:hypothetical protein
VTVNDCIRTASFDLGSEKERKKRKRKKGKECNHLILPLLHVIDEMICRTKKNVKNRYQE